MISLVAMATESPGQKELRCRGARRLAFKVFEAVARQLGEDETRRLFKAIATRDPVRRGRKRGSTDPLRDDELMSRYDVAASEAADEAERSSLPGRLAVMLYDESLKSDAADRFGNSAQAIEKHLRRLLDRRGRLENLYQRPHGLTHGVIERSR
jgi:hypothetical protein